MNAPIPSIEPRTRGVASLGTTALALVSTLLTLFGFPAHAGILFSERFTYPDGPVSETAVPFWRNLTGTPGQIRVANGALRPSEGEAEIVETLLEGRPYSDGTLYASFTLTVTALPPGWMRSRRRLITAPRFTTGPAPPAGKAHLPAGRPGFGIRGWPAATARPPCVTGSLVSP